MLARHVSDLIGPSSGAFCTSCIRRLWYVVIRVLLYVLKAQTPGEYPKNTIRHYEHSLHDLASLFLHLYLFFFKDICIETPEDDRLLIETCTV